MAHAAKWPIMTGLKNTHRAHPYHPTQRKPIARLEFASASITSADSAYIAADLVESASEAAYLTLTGRPWVPESSRCYSLRMFVSTLVSETNCCGVALVYALAYITRIASEPQYADPTTRPSDKELFLLALMVASKFLYDSPASNSAWAETASVSLAHLSTLEREFLGTLDYRMVVSEHEYSTMSAFLQDLSELRQVPFAQQTPLSPMHHDSSFFYALPTPSCSPCPAQRVGSWEGFDGTPSRVYSLGGVPSMDTLWPASAADLCQLVCQDILLIDLLLAETTGRWLEHGTDQCLYAYGLV